MSELAEGTSLEGLAQFDAFLKRAGFNSRDGHLELTFGVKVEHKYDAMPITDHPGRALVVSVEMLVFDGE